MQEPNRKLLIRRNETVLNVYSSFFKETEKDHWLGDYPRIAVCHSGVSADIVSLPTYRCKTKIPKRVYVNNSRNITIEIKREHLKDHDIDYLFKALEERNINKKKEASGTIRIPVVNRRVEWKFIIQNKKEEKRDEIEWKIAIPYSDLKNVGVYCLELEFLSAGFKVDGEKKQKHDLGSESLFYSWNCYFPNSGNHTFEIKAEAIAPDHSVNLGIKEFVIDVVKIDHLTERQVWAIAVFAATLSGCLAVVEVLHRLRLF